MQRRHFAAAHFVRDFSRFGVGKRIECGGLKGGQPPQHALGDTGVAPQHLHRRDDAVAAERRRIPGNAGVRVGALRRLGRQHRKVGHRAARHFVENLVRRGDGGHAARCGQTLVERGAQRLAKRQRGVFRNAAIAFHRHVNRQAFIGLQVEDIGRDAAGKLRRRWIEQHRRAPVYAVETLVVQRDLGLADVHGCGAAAVAVHAPDFEQVGEIAGELERKPDVERAVAVVLHAEALIGGAVQQKNRAHDMQYVFRLRQFLIEIDIGVGQIDDEDGIVVTHVRAQQQRLPAIEQHFKMRQIARVAKDKCRRFPPASRRYRHSCRTRRSNRPA